MHCELADVKLEKAEWWPLRELKMLAVGPAKQWETVCMACGPQEPHPGGWPNGAGLQRQGQRC